ncbi:MAG TPA: cytochrome b N-terminal domain-containing protein [Candidatus Limnocylindrales bacterium]|nr:cytochrome b N-terminal domain-containing protein [Candidatus Limnocylindrales bacterium]
MSETDEKTQKTVYDKIVDWFDVKFGFTKTPLKPIPDFALNPIYWLGLLMAVTFGLQALTGIFMLLYYVPTTTSAYSSTQSIITTVPLGSLVETFHLYGAYAIILLTFLHLVRNYFGSAYKGNRELMWLAGIGLAVVVISFGVTGYLLPWTVVSKSASDVAIGFLNFFPAGIANLGKWVAVGSGSDASELTTFLHIHTVFLPAALVALLGLKIYMYEVHGPAYVPAFGKPGSGKIFNWFPRIFLYFVMLTSVYVAILLAVASLFPLSLPPAYSAATAGTIVVQPDWYLLWLYQLLKIQVFEGPAASYVLAAVIAFGLLLFFMPFFDRSKRRNISQRPLYITIGTVLIFELITLTVWGYYTPGRIIPNWEAVAVLGGVALLTTAAVQVVYRLYHRTKITAALPAKPTIAPAASPTSAGALASTQPSPQPIQAKKQLFKRASQSLFSRFTALFLVLLTVASVSLASAVNMLPTILVNAPFFVAALAVFAVSCFLMCQMLKNYVLAYEGAVAKR